MFNFFSLQLGYKKQKLEELLDTVMSNCRFVVFPLMLYEVKVELVIALLLWYLSTKMAFNVMHVGILIVKGWLVKVGFYVHAFHK